MENERVRITLNRSDNVYFSGETIVGEITLNLVKRTKICDIKIQITGKAKCKWMEIMRKNPNTDTKSLFYTSEKTYIRDRIPKPTFLARGLDLNPGEHKFAFDVPLKEYLPSTFKGRYGSIKYKLRILLQQPWTFDKSYVIPVTVIKDMALKFVNPTPLELQTTKHISLFGNQPITMTAVLPKSVVVRGEPIRICVTVTNGSKTTVEKMRFTILQRITYWSVLPIRSEKCEIRTIVTKETGAVQKNSERSFSHELAIPTTAQTTDTILCDIIHINYELRVEAVLRGLLKNLILNFPFDVYSRHFGDIMTRMQPYNPPQYSGCIRMVIPGNSFENSSETRTMYSLINRNMTNSPNHDQISYSNHSNRESSSLHSSDSNSSTVTMSPTGSCITPPSSSQFNRPSTRTSLSSITHIPCIPYSSSPVITCCNSSTTTRSSIGITENALPSYSFTDTSEHNLLRRQSQQLPSLTVNLSNSSNYTMTSVSSLSSSLHSPPNEHELPPSYEELFGTAPALPSEAAI